MDDGMVALQLGAYGFKKLEQFLIRGPRMTILYFAVRGFLKGFLVYAAPMLLLRRRLDCLPRAFAIGATVFAIRLLQKFRASLAATGVAAALVLSAADRTVVNSLVVSWLVTRAIRSLFEDLCALPPSPSPSPSPSPILQHPQNEISQIDAITNHTDSNESPITYHTDTNESIITYNTDSTTNHNLPPPPHHHLLFSLTQALRAAPWSTVFMGLSAGAILSSWIFAPHQLDRAYLRFLNLHGGQGPEFYQYVRGYAAAHGGALLPTVCERLHPSQSCLGYFCTFWPEAWVRALAVYVPIYTVLLLASHASSFSSSTSKKDHSHIIQIHSNNSNSNSTSNSNSNSNSNSASSSSSFFSQSTFKFILKILGRYLSNVATSSAFLASYCALAWASACFWYRVASPGVTRGKMLLHATVAGLSLQIERPARRAELATYCCTYALQALYSEAVDRRWCAPSTPLGVLLLMGALATLLRCHDQLPSVISGWLLGLYREPRVLSEPDQRNSIQE